MDPKAALIKAIGADQQSQIELLQTLVRAKSPNPPGDCTEAARVVTDYLAQRGIPYEVITVRAGCLNVVSEFACGQQPGLRVVLNGHLDSFPVGDDTSGWARDPWSGDIVDGRVCGRGVVDMKSGTASLLAAYAYLWAVRDQLRGSVALCTVSDEETGGRWGSKHLLQLDRASWGGDVMLSAEPTGMTIRFSEKGTLRMTGNVRTKGAHGAYLNLR
jgi:succinyl-diaminopimelate desuccinylase